MTNSGAALAPVSRDVRAKRGKMKRIKVTLDYQLEIPDDWKVLGTEEPEAGALLVNGDRYEPALTWLKITEMTGTGHTSDPVDAETACMFADKIVHCTETVNCD